jgi:hypothetical protein
MILRHCPPCRRNEQSGNGRYQYDIPSRYDIFTSRITHIPQRKHPAKLQYSSQSIAIAKALRSMRLTAASCRRDAE